MIVKKKQQGFFFLFCDHGTQIIKPDGENYVCSDSPTPSVFSIFLNQGFFGNDRETHKQSSSGLLMLVKPTDKNTALNYLLCGCSIL